MDTSTPSARSDEGRTAGEYLARASYHDGPVREDGPSGGSARRAAEYGGYDGDFAQELDGAAETADAGKYGISPFCGAADRTAGPVREVDERNEILGREVFDETALPALSPVRAGAAAAPHRKVLPADGHGSSVDAGHAHNIGGGLYVNDVTGIVVLACAGEAPDLPERAAVHQGIDPFANGELSLSVVALDVLGPAHLSGPGPACVEFLALLLPAHPDLQYDGLCAIRWFPVRVIRRSSSRAIAARDAGTASLDCQPW